MSLADKLPNLLLLLRVPGFARWPLELRFFCKDVFEQWLKSCAAAGPSLEKEINILCYFGPQQMVAANAVEVTNQVKDQVADHGIQAIDPSFYRLKPHVEIGQSLETKSAWLTCACCKKRVQAKQEMVLVCPQHSCQAPSHMACLSTRFLGSDESQEVVPIEGQCPRCQTTLRWVDLVKELSLRMRGRKEIERVMKPRRKAVAQAGQIEDTIEAEDDESEPEEPDYELSAEDVIDEPRRFEARGESRDDDWECSSAFSALPDATVTRPSTRAKAPSVIQDSDGWVGIEVLE